MWKAVITVIGIIIVIAIVTLKVSYSQTSPFFKITENDKVGYIDSKGKVRIRPQFNNGGEFTEGLAPVRKNGLYGFINESGDFVIKPQFDYSTSFNNGTAIAWKDGIPSFIDKKGNIIIPPIYKKIEFCHGTKALVTTHTNKQGIIDLQTKKFLIDTLYHRINPFSSGVAIVYEYVAPTEENHLLKMAVVDTTGKLIVPLGKYQDINQFNEGFALVRIKTSETEEPIEGVINTKGELLFKRTDTEGNYLGDGFCGGFAKINFYNKNYEGLIDLKGEVILNNKNYRYINDFSDGRAFVQPQSGNYILIDRDFKQVGNKQFIEILKEKFYNNHAIVRTDEGWGIIDTTGRFIIKPTYDDIDGVGIIDDYFFFMEDGLYGIANLNGKTICKPIIEGFDRNGFINGLLQVVIDKRLAYINRYGYIVWQHQTDRSESLKYLNIDFMNRGYFYAYSSPDTPVDEDEPGGYGGSNNIPKIIKGDSIFPRYEPLVVIELNQPDTFAQKYHGYTLNVFNTTGDTVKFNAQDSRLYMKLQAQDKDGKWEDIEYLPSSWCGNSYHKIRLEHNYYWSFVIPDYKGEFPTQIRAQLEYIDKEDPKKTKIIYSNSIQGSINPGQFWNKRDYYPSGLMDPYYD